MEARRAQRTVSETLSLVECGRGESAGGLVLEPLVFCCFALECLGKQSNPVCCVLSEPTAVWWVLGR